MKGDKVRILENKQVPRRFKIDSLMVSIRVHEIIENPGGPELDEVTYQPRLDTFLDIGEGIEISADGQVTFEGIAATFDGADIATLFGTRSHGYPRAEVRRGSRTSTRSLWDTPTSDERTPPESYADPQR